MSAPTLCAALTSALAPALLIAFIFGLRDSLRTVRHNTYIHLSRYFWPYAAVPIVALTALSLLPALAVGLLGYALGLQLPWSAGASAGLLMGFCLAVEARSWLQQFRHALDGARVDASLQRRAKLCTVLPLLSAVALASAAAALIVTHLDLAAIKVAAGLAALLDVVLLPAAFSFVARDFRSLVALPKKSGLRAARLQTSLTSGAGVPSRRGWLRTIACS